MYQNRLPLDSGIEAKSSCSEDCGSFFISALSPGDFPGKLLGVDFQLTKTVTPAPVLDGQACPPEEC